MAATSNDYLSEQDIDEILTVLENRSALEQIHSLRENHPSYSSLAILFADPDYGQFDVASRTKTGSLKANGGYADVYDGKMVFGSTDSTLDSIRQDADKKQALREQRYGQVTLQKVAIKRFRIYSEPSKDFAKGVAKEMRLWLSLKHANVLPLLGFTITDEAPSLVSAWMDKGNLWDFLQRSILGEYDAMKMAIGIANGLQYLHQTKIIHGDLKSVNILIGDDDSPMLADFGISRIAVESGTVLEAQTSSSSELHGSARWMAIEFFASIDHSDATPLEKARSPTTRSDVWAYGMVIYELLTQKLPYYTIENNVLVMFAIYRQVLPEKPKNLSQNVRGAERLWSICQSCWAVEPRKRPSISVILDKLNEPLPELMPDGNASGELRTESDRNSQNIMVVDVQRMLNARSVVSQLKALMSGNPHYSILAELLSESSNQTYDIASRLKVGEVRVFGVQADILDGLLLSRDIDEASLRETARNEDSLHQFLRDNPTAFSKVAIKRFRVFLGVRGTADVITAVAREMRIWMALKHDNILPFLGFAIVGGIPSFVSGWMKNGTLREYLTADADVDVAEMAAGIIHGIMFLHSNRVVHANLQCDNILVDDNGRPLLAGFGISRLSIDDVTLTGTSTFKGNLRWLAIELINNHGTSGSQARSYHTQKSDIWAYGMVVYEILTRKLPYHEIANEMQVLIAIVSGRTPMRPSPDLNARYKDLWKICEICWANEPQERPSAEEIYARIKGMSERASISAQSNHLENGGQQTPDSDTEETTTWSRLNCCMRSCNIS